MRMFLCEDNRHFEALNAVTSPPNRSLENVPASMASIFAGDTIIPIYGPTTKGGTPGGTSTVATLYQLSRAMMNDSVTRIILAIDSPGGTVQGTQELATKISQVAAVKPVIAAVEDMCCSAAYWVASQATEIFACNRIDIIGSIGVVSLVKDTSELMGKLGLKVHRIRSGNLKGIGAVGSPVNEDELAAVQKNVDVIAREFIMAVSKGRRLGADQVRVLATGETWTAAEAVRLGLIDGIKSLDTILDEGRSQLQQLADSHAKFNALVAAYGPEGVAGQALRVTTYQNQDLARQAAEFQALPKALRAKFEPEADPHSQPGSDHKEIESHVNENRTVEIPSIHRDGPGSRFPN